MTRVSNHGILFFSEFAAQVIDVHEPLGTPGAPSGKYSLVSRPVAHNS